MTVIDHHQLIEYTITHIRLLQRGTPNTNQVPLCLWPDVEIEGYSRREAGVTVVCSQGMFLYKIIHYLSM